MSVSAIISINSIPVAAAKRQINASKKYTGIAGGASTVAKIYMGTDVSSQVPRAARPVA